MRRLLLVPLVLAAGGLVPTADALAAPASAVSPLAAPFTYVGADAGLAPAVRLWPAGTVSFRVKNTASVSFAAVASSGTTYEVTVDAGSPQRRVIACDCRVAVAGGLSPGVHAVTVRNTTEPALDGDGAPTGAIRITGWFSDSTRAFRQTKTEVDLARVVDSGETLKLWVRGATTMRIRWLANGTRLWVRLDDQFFNPLEITAANTGTVRGSLVAWGMSPGVRLVSLTVVSGRLDLRGVTLTAPPRSPKPVLLGETPPAGVPVLAVYGDSIVGGQGSMGGDGYAQRLATALGDRVSNQAVAGTSAQPSFDLGCYGRQRVGNVTGLAPAAVVVAYGTNNMLPGPDFWGCDTTIQEFRDGVHAILGQLARELPETTVYIAAIPPTSRVSEETRAEWNGVLIDEAAEHGDVYVDPSAVLDLSTDYADDRHPNNRGHADIAEYWRAVVQAA